jgi:hypothetical protein
MNNDPPWASGPGEILRHGLALLKEDTDANRRLGMIAIDNAVELTIKTYLGLPKRVTGNGISRKDFQEISENFPAMLDALEKHATGKLTGIDLGEVEWYHRLRNQLYHQGNGLTVERTKVEIYAQLANTLFENLFGVKLVTSVSATTDVFGAFMMAWIAFERELVRLTAPNQKPTRRPMSIEDMLRALGKDAPFAGTDHRRLRELRVLRNETVHGKAEPGSVTSHEVRRLQEYTARLQTMAPPE